MRSSVYYPESDSLESYLDALFHYYEAENTSIQSIQWCLLKTTPSLFESILAKFGVSLSDLSFEEIMSEDYYAILKVRGLLDSCNNASFQDIGGVI